MNRLTFTAICMGLAAVSAGCATSSVSTAETSPASAVLAPEMMKPASGRWPVTFKRDTGLMGAACSHRVFVNGTPVADLRAGQAVTIYLPPGDHIAGARANGICGGGDAETALRVLPDRQHTYRIGSDQSGSLRISPTAF